MEKTKFETFTDSDAAAQVLDEIAALYERVFAEPPYFEGPRDLVGFLEGYESFRTMPGFRLVLARAGALVGFAFGVLLGARHTCGPARSAGCHEDVRSPWLPGAGRQDPGLGRRPGVPLHDPLGLGL